MVEVKPGGDVDPPTVVAMAVPVVTAAVIPEVGPDVTAVVAGPGVVADVGSAGVVETSGLAATSTPDTFPGSTARSSLRFPFFRAAVPLILNLLGAAKSFFICPALPEVNIRRN